ncbi:4-amino-4-deoxy-L-arabinose transferase-like glycosyltransferase [Sinorhizobium fredii]|jgi:4-amino-4-deoxy-L-arabinose transferase-like glycosyltransferase|uniref:Putative membrane spanning protein n=1 Tax=Sinorhizobium fredii (strain USDA 257) TaxID=1185652 RepID=I3X0F9_SINF2|nr:glycosyltransferase family 39 protein [Sinorhizobium fredii]AFL49365.1 putative membrane spanning protein [Sinorhizobium fredii USDA 257]
MRDIVDRRPNLVFSVLAGYFLLCIMLRLAASPSLEIDEAEQAFLSQFLQLGYGPQPPFYNWLQYGLAQLIGTSLATMTILKNGLLFLCCLFYGLAAQLVLKDRRLSAIAMFGVLSLPPVFLLAQRDLSHTVAALFAVSLFLYGFLRTLTRPSLFSYLLAGAAVGIGVISKYNFVLVPIAAIVAVLPEPELRKRIFDWRILAAIGVAGVVALPHGLWVLQNLDAASSGTLNEMKERAAEGRLMQALHGVFALASAIIGGSLVTLLVFGLVFRGKIRTIWQAESQWTRMIGRMIAICLLGVLLVVLGVAATHVREKWLVLFLVLLPLYLCLKIEAAAIDPAPGFRRFVPLVACIVLGALVIVSARAVVRPWFGDYSKLNIPYAAFVEAVVEAEGRPPALVLTNDRQVAGNIRTRLADATVVIPHLSDVPLPNAAKRPLLVVWRDKANPSPLLPANLKEALRSSGVPGSAATPRRLEVPYVYASGPDRYGFNYIWVGE